MRLYDYSQGETHALRKIASELVTGVREWIDPLDESWIVPSGGCKLTLQRGERDFDIRKLGSLSFACELTEDGWNNVEELLDPFCKSVTTGFQWLTDRGRIAFLISPSGNCHY